MPYLAHFGLREHPFFLSPTTEHFFPTTESLQLLQLLEQAILRNGGLIKLVGPLSSGKTLTAHLLAQRLMERSDAAAEVALVSAPQSQGAALITAVCKAFGLATNDPQHKPLDLLGTFLVEQKKVGRPCVLVIDDAQTMGLAGLETAQLLSELENDQGRLIHVVLVGQSALDAMLAAKPMQKVRQAIAFSFSTTPFSPAESRDFIERRIAASRDAGATRDVFDAKALDLAVQVTAGIPGSIIVLCDAAMRIAQKQGFRTVTRAHVQAAMLDCPSLTPIAPQRSAHSPWAWIAGIGGCAIGAALAGVILMSPSTRETLRGWVGMAPQEQTQAQAVPPEATAPAATPQETEAPQAPAAAPTPQPAADTLSQTQKLQIETEAQPTPQPAAAPTPQAAPSPAAETAHDDDQPAPTPVNDENSLEMTPVTVVAKPEPPVRPAVAPPSAKPEPPKQAAPAKPEPRKPEPSKPESSKPAPPAPAKPAAAKPASANPTPTAQAPAPQAPAKPAQAAPQSPPTYKAKVGPNGELIWD